MKIRILFIAILLCSTTANAGEIISHKASYKNKIFYIHVVAVVDTSKQAALQILTDYEHLPKLNPKITNSKIISKSADKTIVKTVIKDCIEFFCQEIINTQEVVESDSIIISTTLPEQSNLKIGNMKWEIEDGEKEGTTKITYTAKVKPDFFVPPGIGDIFIKKSMLEDAVKLLENIEQLAKEKGEAN